VKLRGGMSLSQLDIDFGADPLGRGDAVLNGLYGKFRSVRGNQEIGYIVLPASSPTASPTAPPASLPPASTSHEPEDKQQNQRADGGVDYGSDDSRAEMKAELGQQPTADEGADDSDDQIAKDTKPGTLDDLAGQPSGNEPDQQYGQQAFT